jgi:hypothetical protein
VSLDVWCLWHEGLFNSTSTKLACPQKGQKRLGDYKRPDEIGGGKRLIDCARYVDRWHDRSIDFECRRRYRSGCVAAKYLRASELHSELSDWSRLMTAVEICSCGTFRRIYPSNTRPSARPDSGARLRHVRGEAGLRVCFIDSFRLPHPKRSTRRADSVADQLPYRWLPLAGSRRIHGRRS